MVAKYRSALLCGEFYIRCNGGVDVVDDVVFFAHVFPASTTKLPPTKPPPPEPVVSISRAQHEHMLILMRVLYGNPRVLYAPNDTQVDIIMRKVTYLHPLSL